MTPIKDKHREAEAFRRRAALLALGLVLVFGGLVLRYAHLQIAQHQQYRTEAESNRVRMRPLPPPRGLILDRNGIVLAENRPGYRLEVTPELAGPLEDLLDRLAEVLPISDSERSDFLALASARARFRSAPLKLRLSESQMARFAVQQFRFPGVEVVPYLTRHYPRGEELAHVIGYVGRIDAEAAARLDPGRYAGTSHVGRIGIEQFYEDRLHGEVGVDKVEVNAQGRVLQVLEHTPPRPGEDLLLSIDAQLQREAQRALGDSRGVVVAIDPRNGEVLALVSNPSYDPNPFVDGIGREAYAALLADPDRPLLNRVLRGAYEPGSTIKPFIGLAGLELGLRTAEDRIYSTGAFQIPGREESYRDWLRTGHGSVDLAEALAQSVNTYFYRLALDLGIDRIHDYLWNWGFGQKTGLDLGNEVTALLPSREWKRGERNQPWYPGETVILGIGQGFFTVTPMQLAQATAALAQNGRLEPVHLLRAVVRPDGTRIAMPRSPGRELVRDPRLIEPV